MTWYVVCLSSELRKKPLARTVAGTPLVVFRGEDGRPAAFLDRCPHRNVPLSCGTVREGLLECCYHGWRFDGTGACRLVPGLTGDEADRRARRADTHPAAEQDGFVWVASAAVGASDGADGAAGPPPFRFPSVDDPAYSTVRRSAALEAGLHPCLENTLDVPHTAFLHGGLFRGGREPVEIEVVVRPIQGGVEAEYVGEPRPEGVAGRILAPEGGIVTHFDRFLLPSIAQVEYRLGDNHLQITSAFTPVGEHETMLHSAITFSLRLPHAAVKAAVLPIANRILKQDASILRLQALSVRRFGGEHFASTELDVLGQHIRKLLRMAERGESPDGAAPGDPERRVRMRV